MADKDPPQEHLLEDVIKSVVATTIQPSDSEVTRRIAQASIGAERARVKLRGLRGFFKLRKKWSKWIIIWISSLIGFNIALTAFVGWKWMSFVDHEWFVTAVTVETFLQIVGMGYVAVKFLFSNSND